MEYAPLRPVPARPSRPPDPETAAGWLEAALPELDPPAARALAAVALAGRSRAEAAALAAISDAELPGALARARKELRRSVQPLPGSGWCERAEGLISDRLDGALSDRGARCLDAHLRNCPRCVEHERRLVQATDALLAGLAPAGPAPAPSLEPDATPPSPGPDAAPSSPEHPAPLAEAPGPAAEPVPIAAVPLADQASIAAAAGQDEVLPEPPSSEKIASAAEVLVSASTRRQIAAAATWNVMVAVAVLLTVAAIALTVAGILGAEL